MDGFGGASPIQEPRSADEKPPGPRMEMRINRFAAHASSNRLPEQAVRAFNSVRRFTARYYSPLTRTRLLPRAGRAPAILQSNCTTSGIGVIPVTS